jgi:sugar lactone lactonase YvrE
MKENEMNSLGFRLALGLSATVLASSSIAQGNLYVSSEGTNSVKEYNGTTGAYIRDFVAAGDHGLGSPQGLTFDSSGNLYVSSLGSGQVLQYDPNGNFTRVFASGFTYPADITWRNGLLYVSDAGANRSLKRYNASGTLVDTFVTNVNDPDGQSWDAAGNLYLSIFSDHRVAKYSPTGTFLGNAVTVGQGGLNGPLDSLFLANGDYLVNSFGTGTVKRYNLQTGTYLGDFINVGGNTQGIQIGNDGRIYAGDYQNGMIKRFDQNTGALLNTFTVGGGLVRPNNFAFSPVPEPSSVVAIAGLLFCLVRRKRSAK